MLKTGSNGGLCNMRKIRNLNDLAKHMGCTATTVSLALRNSPQLSQELREKIQKVAKENDFSPRSYRRKEPSPITRRHSPTGPLLLLHNDFYNEPNPARDQTMPFAFQLLNQYGVEYSYIDISEVKKNPEIFRDFSGVLYYNDQEIEIPPELPTMQIFGWGPLKPHQDRVTTDDEKIAEIAADFFLSAGVSRVVMVWRDDMISNFYQHPRVHALERRLETAGVPVTSLLFSRQDDDFLERLQEYIRRGDKAIGFFAFNSVSGLKLCSALDIMHLMSVYAPDKLLVCDNNLLLQNFWPNFHTVDLNFPMLTRRAVDGLLWRLNNPDAPESTLYLHPRLLSPVQPR